jgi:hypothetical protein
VCHENTSFHSDLRGATTKKEFVALCPVMQKMEMRQNMSELDKLREHLAAVPAGTVGEVRPVCRRTHASVEPVVLET